MPKTFLATAILKSKDSLTDNPSNSFVFSSDTATTVPSSFGALYTVVANFYNLRAGTTGHPLCYYLSTVLDTIGASQIEIYDISTHLSGDSHGAPVSVGPFTLGSPGGGTSYPDGLAAVLSFRGDYGTDVEFSPGSRPRSRDRGRLYLGPLNSLAFAVDGTTGRSKLVSTFMADAQNAMNNLFVAVSLGGDSYYFRQWSRMGARLKPVTQTWMDDRPDYQRRRSDPNPGSRSYTSVPAYG